MITTLRIDRLSLDLRGIDPATAEAAVRLLGPALQAQMAKMAALTDAAQSGANGQGSARSLTRSLTGSSIRRLHSHSAARDHIDAGRIAAVTEPQALAQRLAQRLAERVARSLVPPVRKG